MGARDASQFLGAGEDTITLTGSMVPEFAGDVASLEATAGGDMLILRGKNDWTLTCESPYETPAFAGRRLYEKFTFDSPRDGKAVLRIKSLDQGGAWQGADMDLRPPHDTIWMRLNPGALNN